MPHKVRAILFDLDGVLWDSVEAHRAAFQKAFQEMHLDWKLPKELFRHVSGMTTENALLHLLRMRKVRWSAERVKDFSRRKRAWALRYLPRKAKLPGQLLLTLKKLSRDYKLALVSAGHPRTIEMFLKRSKTRRFFDVVLTSRDVRFSKPHPQIYRAALRKLKVRPEDAVAVEDAVSGVQAAAGARIPVLGMRGTIAPSALQRAGARKIISRLPDIIKYASHS